MLFLFQLLEGILVTTDLAIPDSCFIFQTGRQRDFQDSSRHRNSTQATLATIAENARHYIKHANSVGIMLGAHHASAKLRIVS